MADMQKIAKNFSSEFYIVVYPWAETLQYGQKEFNWSNYAKNLCVIKNWLTYVTGPAFAMDKIPGPECVSEGSISSGKLYPGPPLPVPLGSPPCIIKSLITR